MIRDGAGPRVGSHAQDRKRDGSRAGGGLAARGAHGSPRRMFYANNHIRRLLIAGALLASLTGRVQAAPCERESFALTQSDPAALLTQARALAAEQRYGRARYVYDALLERQQEVREARLGLARVDAWEHCYAQAELSYRAWLEHAPNDVEALAGLFDVLLWTERLDEAEQLVERSLRAEPQAPELLRRRALVYLRRDQPAKAITAAEQALARAPHDPELRAFRDRIFLSQLRAYARWDRYFGDFPDLHSFALAYWQRVSNFELNLDALVVERSGGALPKAIVDAQYTLGVSYHFGPRATLGGVFGFGAPAKALPRWIGKLWLNSQWSALVGTHLSYAVWDYSADKTVHIVAPVVTLTPSELLSFELRYYVTWLVLHQAGEDMQRIAHTVAGRAVAQLTADLRLGLSYAYGAQLDQATLSAIISFRSHVLSLFADYRPGGRWGLQPLLSVERRAIQERSVWIGSVELGAYVRW